MARVWNLLIWEFVLLSILKMFCNLHQSERIEIHTSTCRSTRSFAKFLSQCGHLTKTSLWGGGFVSTWDNLLSLLCREFCPSGIGGARFCVRGHSKTAYLKNILHQYFNLPCSPSLHGVAFGVHHALLVFHHTNSSRGTIRIMPQLGHETSKWNLTRLNI